MGQTNTRLHPERLGSTNRRQLLQLIALAPFFYRNAHAEAAEVETFRRNAIEGWRKRIKTFLARKLVPIIDTEATYGSVIDLDQMRDWMDTRAVAQVCFAPFAGLGSRASFDMHQRHSEYFIPTTADGSSPYWYQSTERFAETTREDLVSGRYFLMGEFELRHYPSPLQTNAGRLDRDVTVLLDDPGVHAIFRLAEQTGVALQIHYEIEDQLLPQLEALLARYPLSHVIWCHLGQVRYAERNTRYGTTYVASLIKRFPNLRFDLGLPGPPHWHPGSRQRDQMIYAETGYPPWGGYLRSEWRDLMEAYPERILAASDIGPDRWRGFPKQIERLRALILERLSARTSHMIAYQNAWRLISGETWGA